MLPFDPKEKAEGRFFVPSKEITVKSEVPADIFKTRRNKCNSLDLMPRGPNIPVIVIVQCLSFSFVSLLLYTHGNNNSVNALVLQMHVYNCAHFKRA